MSAAALAEVVTTLERALQDARNGRLVAFVFAGVGRGEHAIAYSFDEHDVDQCSDLMDVTQKVMLEVTSLALTAQPTSGSAA